MVHVADVAQLMDDDIVDHVWRTKHQPPRKIDALFAAAGSPSSARTCNMASRRVQSGLCDPIRQSLVQISAQLISIPPDDLAFTPIVWHCNCSSGHCGCCAIGTRHRIRLAEVPQNVRIRRQNGILPIQHHGLFLFDPRFLCLQKAFNLRLPHSLRCANDQTTASINFDSKCFTIRANQSIIKHSVNHSLYKETSVHNNTLRTLVLVRVAGLEPTAS